MMLSYSLKVLFANFSNMWKVLLYRLIVLIVTTSLAVGLMLFNINYLLGEIRGTGIFTNLSNFISGIFTGQMGTDYSAIFRDDLAEVGKILLSNVSKLVQTYFYLVLIFCISRFLNGVADYALTDVVNSNMSACAHFGFTGCVIKNLKKATRFTLARMMFTIPFDVGVGTLLAYMFVTLFSPLGLFMPFFVMLTAIVLFSFRNTLFSGWLPAVVADGCGIFEGLKTGVKTVFSRFWKVYSTWVILLFLVVFLGGMVAIFTCGVGIVVLVPTIILLTVIFYLVMYYGAKGRRYYIDHETIVTPRLLHDRERLMTYEIRNNVFYDNPDSKDDEDDGR